MATYVYASSQGQRMHSARTNGEHERKQANLLQEGNQYKICQQKLFKISPRKISVDMHTPADMPVDMHTPVLKMLEEQQCITKMQKRN